MFASKARIALLPAPIPLRDFGLWLGLWGGGFAISMLFAYYKIAFHQSFGAFLALIARDTVFTWFAYRGWSRVRSRRSRRTQLGLVIDSACVGAAVMGTAIYWLTVSQLQLPLQQHDVSALAFAHLHWRMPLRLICFVSFQQYVNTYYLFDIARGTFGDRRGLLLTVLLFSLSHVGACFLGVSLSCAMLLVAASACGMVLWGILRLRCGVMWAPFCIHYLFYVVGTLTWTYRSVAV